MTMSGCVKIFKVVFQGHFSSVISILNDISGGDFRDNFSGNLTWRNCMKAPYIVLRASTGFAQPAHRLAPPGQPVSGVFKALSEPCPFFDQSGPGSFGPFYASFMRARRACGRIGHGIP
jgi:hypothetical protein